MSFLPNLPPSVLAKNAEAESLGARRSKEDYRKMKELEEARKLAAVPAMKDEEGKDINPHIPQYIMQAPWYYGALHPTLKHQNKPRDKAAGDAAAPGSSAGSSGTSAELPGSAAFERWYKRGVADAPQATKFRKGACANCGAMTHQARDCFERPRTRGARWTGEGIAPDEHLQPDLKLDFDAKRDRWNGFNPADYRQVIDSYTKLEEARKLVRSSKQEAGEQEQEPDEDRYGDEMAMPGQKFDSKERQSIRNLRIREDTAKYLYNLDPDSAYYDAKTRAMRGNPFADKDIPLEEAPFAGDNYIRYQGDALPMMQQQVFAWELNAEKGIDAHLQANPTRLELLKRELDEKSREIGGQISKQILEKYGGQEHLLKPEGSAGKEDDDGEAALAAVSQTEHYAEYSRTGTLVRGAEAPAVRSRYTEDAKPLNHTSVWGSYWEAGRWGFKCCRCTMRNAYCTGLKGRLPMPPPAAVAAAAAPASTAAAAGTKRHATGTDEGTGGRAEAKDSAKSKRQRRGSSSSSSSSSDSSSSSSDSSSSDSSSSEDSE